MQYKWLGSETTFPYQFQPSYCRSVLCMHGWLFQVDWCSGLTSRLELWLGGGAECSIPRSTFVFCGGENVGVHSLCTACVWAFVCAQHCQSSPSTEGFKLCWRSGKKAHLETILFGRSNPLRSHSFSFFFFIILALYQLVINCDVVWYTAVFCICIRFFFY